MLKLITPETSAAPVEPHPLRYWAFLSYSHHDKLIAKRLQRQLETYRVPRRLVGRETSVGPVPARVTPVFRDRDELHAGADLKASVQEALSRSRWLIVVCTPDAARSPWVNREIIEFKRLRGERHVLALIARGEPFASDMPGREAEECFPPALRRALTPEGVPEGEPLEPIAADMRKHGDGPQRAMLKLLAGMVGVGFDDLVRRDMQRRVRLLSAVAGASVLGVVVLALMAVMAVQARNEAQHQRVQAEGLIEFMLGDLRKKLEPVGRLEVLDSVGEKALAYYGAQEADKLDSTALGHRSRAMHLIGEIRDLRGNPVEAQAAFEQAAGTTAQLLAQAPNDGQRIFDHAQSVFWVGYAAWKRADGKTAEARFQDYLELARRLVSIDPHNVDWRAEIAFANVNLGVVQLGSDRPDDALNSLGAAAQELSAITAVRPGYANELAQAHGWRADARELRGEYSLAIAEQAEKLAIIRAKPGVDLDLTAQREVVSVLHSIAVYEIAMGQLPSARVRLDEALALASKLLEADPANLRWRGDACSVQLRSVEIDLSLRTIAQAERNFIQAARCVDQYANAGSRGFRDTALLQARKLSLAAHFARDNKPLVRREIESYLDDTVPKLNSSTPHRAKLAAEVANTALALADMVAREDPGMAHAASIRAEGLLRPFAHLHDGAILTALGRARLNLGDHSGALRLQERIQSSSYRHPAYADFVKEVQAVRGGGRPIQPGERK